MHAVLASKSTLVHGYAELAALTSPSAQLRFSGAVGGALPTVNVGRRDLAAADIRRVEAVLNGTTQLILTLMATGESFEGALEEAQRIGIAEPDPSLDVDGWDTANKLIIIANAVLNLPLKLDDLPVQGIFPLDTHGERYALLGIIERGADGQYQGQRQADSPCPRSSLLPPGPRRNGHCLLHGPLRADHGDSRRAGSDGGLGGHAA